MVQNEQNSVPADATAMHAEAVVKAAQAWAWSLAASKKSTRMTRTEWELLDACNQYGDQWKGLMSR